MRQARGFYVLKMAAGVGLVTAFVAVMVLTTIGGLPVARAELPLPVPPSLKTIPVPEPPDLANYVKDRQAAIVLGKALFWDMQVGSDGKTACATCHFKAGADGRTKNQLNPGQAGGDNTFQLGGPNYTLESDDFPFHERQAPHDQQESPVVRDVNDVAGSQGVRSSRIIDLGADGVENVTPLDDPVFNVGGVEVRQTTGRNAPTVINAALNFASFHDGRANNIFNGVSPFGAADANARVFNNAAGSMEAVEVRIRNASLASQAVGPVLNDVEMSAKGRTFPQVARKLLGLTPLGQQLVHVNDSSLGSLSRQNSSAGQKGLSSTYSDMIRAAFIPTWWDNTTQMVKFQNGVPAIMARSGGALLTDEFSQMEANFSLFFGLAVQMYESTLISNDSTFDRVQEGVASFTPQQQKGFDLFTGGFCIECHVGPEFTGAAFSTVAIGAGAPVLVEPMSMGNGQLAMYDTGYYNIGVSRISDDIGRAAFDPFGFPLSFSELGKMKRLGTLPPGLAAYVTPLATELNPDLRTVTRGSFKTPTLRNVELTGPYFHNGSVGALEQVIEFYARGGNFPVVNQSDLDPIMKELGFLQSKPEDQAALIAFLISLTDERVKNESAPFDHPELLVPDGADPANPAQDTLVHIPAVGGAGRTAQGSPRLSRFLAVNNAPLAISDTAQVNWNSAGNLINVLLNDGDLDGDPVSVTAASVPASGGSATVGSGGAIVLYTPAPWFSGTDTFTYTLSDGTTTANATVTINVKNTNAAPLALADTVRVGANSSINIVEVLANDRDSDLDNISITGVTAPPNGTAGVGAGGANVIYMPNPGFAGVDTFTYTISDGLLTASGAVSVTVNRPPVATADAITVTAGILNQYLDVLRNDSDPDGDPMTVIAVGAPSNGFAAIDPRAEGLLYSPNDGFAGIEVITYAVTDAHLLSLATVTITVNRPPLAVSDNITVTAGTTNNSMNVLANDTDPDANTLSVTSVGTPSNGTASAGPAGATLLYSPNAGFFGTDTFTYTMTDGALTSTATLTVTVNRAPVAVDDAVIVQQDTPDSILGVLSNDTDADGHLLTVTAVTQGGFGSVAIKPGGSAVTYSPRNGYAGSDSFTYTATDGWASSTATVTVSIAGPTNLATRRYLPTLANGPVTGW